MSKSINNRFIIYTLFQTIRFRVLKQFLLFILIYLTVVFNSYLWSGLIVVFGIYLNFYSRNEAAFNATIVSYTKFLFCSRWWSKYSTPTTTRTLPV
jgi:hypothetical protein